MERRAFRHAYANDCWMGDVMHGPKMLNELGCERKAYLHVFIDSATRFIVAAGFRFGEKALDFEAVLKQAILKHGIPRMLYVDNGAAQTADSLRLICAELGVYLRHCRPYDPQAKGAVERFLKTFRAEVLDELGDEPRPLTEVNALSWSWISAEYHRREHGGTGRIPLDHWLEQVERLQPAPSGERLDAIFLHRERRKVRKDGTLRFRGAMLEVRSELSGMEVELRFDPEVRFDPTTSSTLPDVYVDGRFVCDTVVLEPIRNSARKRQRKSQPTSPDRTPQPSGIDPLAQIADEHARRVKPPGKSNTSDEE